MFRVALATRLPFAKAVVPRQRASCATFAKVRLFSSTSQPSTMPERVLLFRTPPAGIRTFRLYGAFAYGIFGAGLFLIPQLLAEHEWAPLWLRTGMAGLVLMFGGGLVPIYAMYLNRNVFSIALQNGELILTTLSPALYKTVERRIPASMVHPEPRQGKWLRLVLKDAKYGDKKLTRLYLERTGQYVQYRTLETLVKTGALPPSETNNKLQP